MNKAHIHNLRKSEKSADSKKESNPQINTDGETLFNNLRKSADSKEKNNPQIAQINTDYLGGI